MQLSNMRFPTGKSCAFLFCAWALCAVTPAFAGPKAVYRVDRVSVTAEGNKITIDASGAVRTGGWFEPRLVVKAAGGPTMVLELRAIPPLQDDAVIQSLMPVEASTTLRMPANVSSVQVISETNTVSEAVGR
jgi:hypothetical protein